MSSIPREEWGTFDVLVSNPPYIPTDVMRSLPHEVKDFEPDLALEGGADGLDIFRRLLNAAPYMLRAGGLFACELYEAPSMPRPSSVARRVSRTCASSATSPIVPASSEPSSPSPNSASNIY